MVEVNVIMKDDSILAGKACSYVLVNKRLDALCVTFAQRLSPRRKVSTSSLTNKNTQARKM